MGGFLRADANLKNTRALPNGAATVYSSGIETGNSSRGDFLADCELLLTVPALATGVLGDAATVKYSLQHDDDPAFGSPVALEDDIITQTGAGGAGAAGTSKRFRLPTNVKKNIRLKVVKSASGDASGSSATLELLL
jgi:hypothetical protein